MSHLPEFNLACEELSDNTRIFLLPVECYFIIGLPPAFNSPVLVCGGMVAS